MGEWSFFQIEPHTIGDDWAVGSRKGMRNPDMKISNFGSLFYGSRMSTDYTRTVLDFEDKSEMEGADKMGVHDLRGAGRYDAERDQNPYVLNSSVKTVRDDQFVRMGMSMGGTDALGLNNPTNAQIEQPKFDVMDTNVMVPTTVSGLSDYATDNYPTEGWRSFGGKYDFHYVYDGTLR